MAGVQYPKKQGKQDTTESSDFGAVAAFMATDSPSSVKDMVKGGKGGTQSGVTTKYYQK